MLFNSIEFLIFFAVVSVLYFSLPYKGRWIMLLVASCFFYMFFKIIYIFILVFTIIIDYYAGILIENQQDKRKRKFFLAWSIVANVGVLAFFKYFNFLNGNLSGILTWMGYENPVPYLKILLPIGLSFHTFQAMSYTIEVYRGNQKAEKHFGIYALYVMFYPQLVAGPIERPQNILHQLKEYHRFDYEKFKSGLNLMIWGFFKKIVVADRLSVYVGKVYGDCTYYDSLQIAIATLFFAIQIYCDFSGYSDIAIGAARTMGIDLMTNFNRPYFSTNIREFWAKWHISLSSWFRDYLYIPLGGNRVAYSKQIRNVVIVFMLSGLWHGANWTFVIWGALHALYIVTYMIFEKYGAWKFKHTMVTKVLCILFTFLIVDYAWIFFRANSLHDAIFITQKLFTGNWSVSAYKPFEDFGITSILISIVVVIYTMIVERFTNPRETGTFSTFNKEAGFAILNLSMIFILGSFNQQTFIYFQF
jgi:alginate O-acetyltransferase complex protein AlgI